jgi:uncharacterized protein with PQ loop repeat
MNDKIIEVYTSYMNIVGPLSNVMFFIQAYKILRTKSSKVISIPAFVMSLLGAISWLVYGLLIQNNTVIFASGISTIGIILVLIVAIWYKKN